MRVLRDKPRARGRWIGVLLALGAALVVANTGVAQTTEVPPQASDPQILVRVGGHWFAQVAQATIVEMEPVDEIAFDARVRGNSKTTTRLTCQVADRAESAAIRLSLEGEIVSHTICRQGPARVYSIRKIPFTAEKLITFDGTRLQPHPATMTCLGNESVHHVHSVQGGMRRLVVVRVAQQRLETLKSAADALALKNAKQRVQRRFDRDVERGLASLNRGLTLLRTARRVTRPLVKGDVQLVTTAESLQLAIGGEGLPPCAATNPSRAVEIYVQDAALSERMRARLERWQRWRAWRELAFADTPPLTLRAVEQLVGSFLPQGELRKSGSWWVIHWGPAEPVAPASALPPSAR